MTIKYIYECNSCGNDYIEQRGKDEPNAYFTICHACKSGNYQEVLQEVIAIEPERVAAPAEIIEESVDDQSKN